jgi:uncharacterized protein
LPQAKGVVSHVVTFGRVLRQAGLEVGPGRVADALRGLDQVDLTRRDDVYWTLRANFVTRHEEVPVFDRVFQAWFLRAPVSPLELSPPTPRSAELRRVHAGGRPDDAAGVDESPAARGWSYEEILRTKDFGAMTSDELERVRALIADIAAERPRRRSRRLRRHHRGELDLRRTIRESLGAGGDPVYRQYRLRARVPRKLVVLCDVSGSMEAYVRPLLLFLHAIRGSGKGVEAFAFGTRLTRLTPALETSDPDRALENASRSVADWCGGTRIGASLKTYNDDWGHRRALTRGAVVLIASDGWEREVSGAGLLEEQMARLARQAYTVVWMNPLKGHPAYEPLAAGMRAALPHVDRFLPGHNLASLERLGEVLMSIERRHAA